MWRKFPKARRRLSPADLVDRAVKCAIVIATAVSALGVVGATSPTLAEQPGSRTFETPVIPSSTGRSEPSIAVSLKDPNNLVMTANDGNIWYSFDGGRSWKDSGTPSLIDAEVVSDGDGTFYHGGLRSEDGIGGVTTSTDGGRTWSALVSFGAPPSDRIFMASDLSNGVVYLTGHTDGAPGGVIDPKCTGQGRVVTVSNPECGRRFVVASHDHGKTWGPLHPYDSVTYPGCCTGGYGGTISAANGVLAAAYFASAANGYSCSSALPCIVFETSTDDGATWLRHVVLQHAVAPWPLSATTTPCPDGSQVQQFYGAFLPRAGYILWQPYVAADPRHAGRYAVMILTSNGAQMTVYVTNDSGASWKPSIVTPESGAIVDRPWMAYSPNGVLGLLWKAAYANKSNSFDAWAAISPSGGQGGFQPAVRLSSAPSPLPSHCPEQVSLEGDDLTTVVLNDRTLFAAWGDYRASATSLPPPATLDGLNAWPGLNAWFGRYDFRGNDEEAAR
jgi:photosystem II stability/assembly factor-like uncharacterized protein